MTNKRISRQVSALALIAVIWIAPTAAIAQQTKIVAPKNKYKVQEDIKLGSDAAGQVERQMPILNDAEATRYVESVGMRLVRNIPVQFRNSAFNYRFKIVNARDINAFALPGGPMYVNRGMIEAAKTEGEMAGVMAHEISHVALRHATAQQTKQMSGLGLLGIGAVIAGGIFGGEAVAQLGMLGLSAWMTSYSREYETQADLLGAKIMADSGYNPRDLANMFRTIAGENKGGAPEWLSSHPDPGNRYEKINKEAQYLPIARPEITVSRDFSRTKERLMSMPRAKSMAEIEKETKTGQGTPSPTTNGKYTATVAYPSARMRSYAKLNWLRMNVPTNWLDFTSQDDVMFAPEGAYGDQGITRGMMAGIYRSQGGDLYSASDAYLNGILQANSYLSRRGQFIETYVADRQGLTIVLSGRSTITNRTEIVSIYTAQLRSGDLFYIVTVAPETEVNSYNSTFRNVMNSIRLND